MNIEHDPSLTADPQPQHDSLEALATDFIERLRRGEHPSVTGYAAKYPALAEEIRELFPTIAAMEQAGSAKEEMSSKGGMGSGGR